MLAWPRRGHIWATDDRIAADNTGHHRCAICFAHQAHSGPAAGYHKAPGSLTRKRLWDPRLVVTVETTENRRAGDKLCKPLYARSALGPCHNGRAGAWAVTNGRPRLGGTAGRGRFGSRSWDNADERFRLWSRGSGSAPSGSRQAATGVRNDRGTRPQTVEDHDRRFWHRWSLTWRL
jgi:hypothetical protein